MIQASTMFSDLLLCIAALLCAVVVAADARVTRRLAAFGFLLLAFSAALGALRYGGLPAIEPLHRLVVSAAAMVGMPVVALSLWLELHSLERRAAPQPRAWLGLFLLSGLWILLHDSQAWRLGASVLAQILWMAIAWRLLASNRHVSALILFAVAITLFAGLVVGNTGEWNGVPRVDLLHYLLALAQLALLAAIRGEHVQREDHGRQTLGHSHG